MKSNLVDVTVQLIHETDKAWLVTIDGENNVWLPKSQVELVPDAQFTNWILTAPESLLIEKGLV